MFLTLAMFFFSHSHSNTHALNDRSIYEKFRDAKAQRLHVIRENILNIQGIIIITFSGRNKFPLKFHFLNYIHKATNLCKCPQPFN